MTRYEIYSFLLCMVVLVSLTALFVTFLRLLLKYYLRLVRYGLEDEAIQKEAAEAGKKRSAWEVVNTVLSIAVCAVLLVTFALSITVQATENKHPFDLSTWTVVKSSSMSYKEEKNKHLFQNNLNDQFQTFDLILIDPMPDEWDVQLYDIVVYEAKDGTMIVHRIVGIEEPNETHPEHRYFRFQGDAVQLQDRYPVLYSQMRGIYHGKRIPFIGSFVMFMQSPAGWICILLVLFAMIATPMVEKRIRTEKQHRLNAIASDGTSSSVSGGEQQ